MANTIRRGEEARFGAVSGSGQEIETKAQFEQSMYEREMRESGEVPMIERPAVREWLDSKISSVGGEPIEGLTPEQERRYAEALLIGSGLVTSGVVDDRKLAYLKRGTELPNFPALEVEQIEALNRKYLPLLRPAGGDDMEARDRRFSQRRMNDRMRRDPEFARKVEQLLMEREASGGDRPRRGRGVDFA